MKKTIATAKGSVHIDLTLEEEEQMLIDAENSRIVSIKQSLLNDIVALESKITPRRIREAMISGDYSFIEAIESQISELRAQLV